MTWIYYVEAPTNSTGRIIRGNNPSAISGCPDIPGFLLLDDLANELLLSAGLGTDRILTCDRRIFYVLVGNSGKSGFALGRCESI